MPFAAPSPVRSGPAALAEALLDVLPQTQCGRCGYPGCTPYAEAMAAGDAGIERCPPGGVATLRGLAALLGVPERALDPSLGTPGPRARARIDEAACIGCTLCIQACPVDAIAGAAKRMHTVVAAECTGCELCLPPCPVDCIAIEPAPWSLLEIATGLRAEARQLARLRHEARARRMAREGIEHARRMADKAQAKLAGADLAADPDRHRKRAIVEAALARARARLAAAGSD